MANKRYIDKNADLISACARGNRKSQFDIYKLYYKPMYNIALRILVDTAEAEDVMQESFLKAFEKIDTYKGEVSFGAWLKKIVVNRSLDVLKARKTLLSIDSASELEATDESDNTYPSDDLNLEIVKQSINNLPEGYRVVLTLYLIEGYDHDEISEILGITSATSRTQYHRAKKKLAFKLKELKAVS